MKLRKQGTGVLKLVDGKRVKLALTRAPAGDLPRLKPGQVRLIVLPDGQLRGAAESRPPGGRAAAYFISSPSAP